MDVDWQALSALGAIATPLVVLVLGFTLTRRQSRSEELLKARLDYYRSLIPKLNDLMCYLTFIGDWRDVSPPEVVRLKRDLDRELNCAAPLFSDTVKPAYDAFMNHCFRTFNEWGSDPLIMSSAYRRRQAWRPPEGWEQSWDGSFAYSDAEVISGSELMSIRSAYDTLVKAMVTDLNLERSRSQYTSAQVSLNASAARRQDISGSHGDAATSAPSANPFHELTVADETHPTTPRAPAPDDPQNE
jgi:hypothetical protein